jgi:hypothetical protein
MHIDDQVTLYTSLLDRILDGSDIPYGAKRGGYYFAENGTFCWGDLSRGIADRLKEKGFIEDASLVKPSDEDLNEISTKAIPLYPAPFVEVAVAGRYVRILKNQVFL